MSDIDLLNIFWDEATEYLETLNNTLLQIEMISPENDPETYQATVKEMNRVAHSLKGAARAVGINVIETVSHYMEEVFGAAMESKLDLTPDVADTLYDGLDLIQTVADGLEVNETTLATVLEHMERIVAATSDAAHAPPRTATSTNSHRVVEVASVPIESTALERALPETEKEDTQELPVVEDAVPARPAQDTGTVVIRQAEESVRVTVSKLDRLMAEVTELFVARMHGEEQLRALDDLRGLMLRWQREWRSVRTAYIRLVRRLQDKHEELSSELPIIFRFLESNQRQLGEANRMLAALSHNMTQDTLRLSALADQLQDDIGGLLLVPFETIVGGFQRMVRDLSRELGKQVQFEIDGMGVEIDKTVLDVLKDPLMHLIRNSVDHGLETPEQRKAAGKLPSGRLLLSIEQRGSEIVIHVTDDGHGIDPDAVRRSAIKRGLLTESDASKMADDDIRTYIFYSGLSTTDKVTTISGRGMGMDIVRDRVEGLRGRVSVQSVVGQGTTISLNVPVSLTRIRCVILTVGEQRFAVPSAMVMRMSVTSRNDVFTAEGRDMLQQANQPPMPLASLASVLGIPSSSKASEDFLTVVALQATDRAVAFEVDQTDSEMELVLKPLGKELAKSPFVSGAALLGSGEVIIVLDANDLVRRATGTVLPQRRSLPINATTVAHQRMQVLVVDDSITTRTLEKNILETAGFEVYTAMDGTEAWAMLPQHDFDVVISDVEMPNMTGLELCARIKSSGQFQHLPVVLLTSLSKPEQREAGLRVGANAYLVKSQFDQGELLETIQSVVG